MNRKKKKKNVFVASLGGRFCFGSGAFRARRISNECRWPTMVRTYTVCRLRGRSACSSVSVWNAKVGCSVQQYSSDLIQTTNGLPVGKAKQDSSTHVIVKARTALLAKKYVYSACPVLAEFTSCLATSAFVSVLVDSGDRRPLPCLPPFFTVQHHTLLPLTTPLPLAYLP